MQVLVKHSGQTYPIDVDVAAPVAEFKQAIYNATGVPIDRMKIMLRGILKDDADMSKLGLKDGQVISVIGAAGPLPLLSEKPPVFLEDMDDAQLAARLNFPPGLVNLGNTCYLNSSLQVMRAIPELQVGLQSVSSSSNAEGRLAKAINHLYQGMSQTAEAVSPAALLMQLRSVAPRFSETDQRGQYAQQDADEAWTVLLSALRTAIPGLNGTGNFIDDWLSLELSKTLSTQEAPEEPSTLVKEKALKLECNITINTNFLMSGILDNLDQEVEKHSPSLNRTAVYNSSTRLSRLPGYLAVHLVRFYWRRDIQKKAKIMRKVKFPLQLDTLDLVTTELRDKLQPVNAAVKTILKERDDRAKQAAKDRVRSLPSKSTVEDELRATERQRVASLIDQDQVGDGSNPSGMYELCAMVTHKGASADAGHYIGWARKDGGFAPSGEEEWYKFDDDKVSTVTASKILSMDGGGEDSVAYLLLYRAVQL